MVQQYYIHQFKIMNNQKGFTFATSKKKWDADIALSRSQFSTGPNDDSRVVENLN